MDAEAVRDVAAGLPADPGVYQFRNGDGATLYVGKAVDLRSRVRSYADPRSARIEAMVERAADVDFAVTDTETQALLLEANLIKRHQPRYNVRLKDDKSYPLVRLTDDDYPRIEVTRDPERTGGDATRASAGGSVSLPAVYGPYTDVTQVEAVVKAVRDVYGLRGCSNHKFRDRERPCLDHDIGLCSAPCTGETDAETYLADVEAVARFFGGETGVLADPIEREMERAAQAEAFERAANLRDRLAAVRAFHGGRGDAVAGPGGERRVDVLGVAVEGDTATVARLHSDGGQLVERERHTLAAPDGDERVATVLAAFVPQYYAERALPDALLLPEDPEDADVAAWLDDRGVAVRVPAAGREATLVELAVKNAHRRAGRDDELGALRDALGLDRRPVRIEGVDVSHAQGKAVVGSDVTFVEGDAETADYRRKKLGEENDDYANMRRLVAWRARRALDGTDDRPDPDLLLVDGGRGQLDAARDALVEAGWEVPAVALAKREEVVVTPDGTHDWDADAPQLHVLQRVRDESHRFAVQYHQRLRDTVATALDDVDGIGPETRKRLLRRFGSVDGVRNASRDELREVDGVGPALAERIDGRL